MARYSLRNKDKIAEKLGKDALNRIVQCLDSAFSADIKVYDIALNPKDGYPVLVLKDIKVYIIKITFDVYILAFKEFNK